MMMEETDQKNMNDNLAPVVLFVYNRPEHVKKTVEALRNNILSEQSDLYIFSDGPKGAEDEKPVKAVREYIAQVTGFHSVHVTERETNIGLGRNIMDGVTRIVNRYGKIIVLEDDILTSEYFLQYMNEALTRYEADDKVMSVSGYTPPASFGQGVPETFFMSWPDCWGWGTWARAWKSFERDPEKLVKTSSKEFIRKVNIDGTSPGMWKQVLDNYHGRRYTWAIFFHVAICRAGGLTLYSRNSLTSNEGMDGSGDDSGSTFLFGIRALQEKPVTFYPEEIRSNPEAEKALKEFCRKSSREQVAWKRLWNVLTREGMRGLKKRAAIYLGKKRGS